MADPTDEAPGPALDLTAVDRVLAEREAELVAQTEEMTRPPTELGTISFGKRVGDGTQLAVDRLVQVSAHGQLTAMLESVRRARARLAEGTYGTCEECGAPIPVGRLEARPWANRCVACSA